MEQEPFQPYLEEEVHTREEWIANIQEEINRIDIRRNHLVELLVDHITQRKVKKNEQASNLVTDL